MIALAFVVVYKASRVMNFALGEWVMFASRFTATGFHAFGLGLAGALVFGCAGMAALAMAFDRLVLRRLARYRTISLLMVTLGLGAFLRGVAPVIFAGVPGSIPSPIPGDPLDAWGIAIPLDKLVAAVVALGCVAAVGLTFQKSRVGVALRAISDDPQTAMAMGIDVHRYFAMTWAIAGALAVVGGVLWAFTAAGGLGMVLVGLKVFPIVVIGGLDSITGTILGAVFIGVLETLAVGYLDPLLGAGFSNVGSYLVLLTVMFVRPYGMFGKAEIERV